MTAMLATDHSRREFAKTTANFLRKYDFDGIDLDFEYPGSRGSPAEDKQRYARLVQVGIFVKVLILPGHKTDFIQAPGSLNNLKSTRNCHAREINFHATMNQKKLYIAPFTFSPANNPFMMGTSAFCSLILSVCVCDRAVCEGPPG